MVVINATTYHHRLKPYKRKHGDERRARFQGQLDKALALLQVDDVAVREGIQRLSGCGKRTTHVGAEKKKAKNTTNCLPPPGTSASDNRLPFSVMLSTRCAL